MEKKDLEKKVMTKEELEMAKKLFPHTEMGDDPDLDFNRPEEYYLLMFGMTCGESEAVRKEKDRAKAAELGRQYIARHAEEVKELNRKYGHLRNWWKEQFSR